MIQKEDFTTNVTHYSLTAKLLILFGICILGTFGFSLIGMFFGLIITKIPMLEFVTNIQKPEGKEMWSFLMILTGISHLGGFWLAGLAYLKLIEKRTFDSLNKISINLTIIPIIILLVIFFLPFNEFFISLNAKMELPKALDGVQNWMKTSEESAAQMTKFLMDFTSIPQLIVAFIVIACFAGIGEELIFRGIIQNLLHKKFQNHHMAIWLSAIIFSAIHLQFFGFIPRMLLGALFGYLYVWSGSLWVPIVGHITNNGFIVIMMYLAKINVITTDVENLETPTYITLLFTALCAGLIWVIYKQKTQNTEHEPAL
jgi:uncharacterized protein